MEVGKQKKKQMVFPTFCKVTAYRKGGIFIEAFICVFALLLGAVQVKVESV